MNAGRVRTLRTAAEFQRVYKTGRTYHGPAFTLRVAATEDRGAADSRAFGFVVSTKVSKSAVVRNRIRRRAREFVRRAAADGGLATGRDIAVIAKPPAAALDSAGTVRELSSLFKQATLIR